MKIGRIPKNYIKQKVGPGGTPPQAPRLATVKKGEDHVITEGGVKNNVRYT